jgi:putative radical SAM enzyme (TIGR03279 family)
VLIVKSTSDDPVLIEAGIRPGSKLLEVNGRPVCDTLDYDFFTAPEDLILLFETESGERMELEIEAEDLPELGLDFESDKVRTCRNNCIFCFIHQLPKGLRKSLYVKDEDYRLSFRHGNYITLTNLTAGDLRRITEQRLSPLYISVHSTDETVRRKLLGREDIPPVMPIIHDLVDGGIELHAQVVLCPGINDGDVLLNTIDDLANFHPRLSSVAVVPVGLSRFRRNLPEIQPVTREIASTVLDTLVRHGERIGIEIFTRFVYPADEFFILAGRDIPHAFFYEDFPQVENGVGMVRQLLNSDRAYFTRFSSPLHLTIATGYLIGEILGDVLSEKWAKVESLSFEVIKVPNNLLGESITVSGLLCGSDIVRALESSSRIGDCVVVPPNCLNDDGLFLDDMTLTDVSTAIKSPVVAASYSPAETLERIQLELGL